MRARPAVLLPLAALYLFAAGAERILRREARRAGLSSGGDVSAADAASALAVTCLGGARGLYVDYLWYQSLLLYTKDRSRLHDLPLYYRPMALLQPHFVEMWSATGWALAYNASAKFREGPEAAWPWIRAGIERMREGLSRNASHPKRYKLHRELAWTLLQKCTPYQDPAGGEALRARAREAWGEDPFAAAARHFGELARFKEVPDGQKLMAALVYVPWARACADAREERERLLAGAAAWEAFGLRHDPAAGEWDHRQRMLALAEGAGGAAAAEEALRRGDPTGAHAAWWSACRGYLRASGDFPELFQWRGPADSFGELPGCLNWPYAASRLARLGASRPVWEALLAANGRFLPSPEARAEERRLVLAAAERSEAFRSRRKAQGAAAAAFADLGGAELLSMAKAARGEGRRPEAAACLERILFDLDDEAIRKEAESMLKALEH